MDLTGWLEYYVEGLTTQLEEVRSRSEVAIRTGVVLKAHGLNPRQAASVGFVLENGQLEHLRARGPLPGSEPSRRLHEQSKEFELVHSG